MNDEADLDIARGPVPGAPLHGSNHEKSARWQAKLIQNQGFAAADTLQGNITAIDQEIDGPSSGAWSMLYPSLLYLIVHGNEFQGGGWICPGIPNMMGFTHEQFTGRDEITPDWCRLEETR